MANSNDWFTFHGDNARTGNVQGSDICAATIGSLKELHTLFVGGAILSVPAVADGYVYVGTANGTEVDGRPRANGGSLHKISLEAGTIEKSYFWQTSQFEGDTHGFMGMGCTPAVVDGKVYFSAFDGKLRCLKADDLSEVWTTNLRYADLPQNQPVNVGNNPQNLDNLAVNTNYGPQPEGWCSPLVVDGKVYVGIGEGENYDLFAYVFCLNAETGKVVWVLCTSQFEEGVENRPNVLPPSSVDPQTLPSGFEIYKINPGVIGCVVWSALTYDAELNQVFCTTGNPKEEEGAFPYLPAPGYAYSILALDAATGAIRNKYQIPPESSYRVSDFDIDFGASAVVYDLPNGSGATRKVIYAGCKNGSVSMIDAKTFELIKVRQILPYYNNGGQIPTVDPHAPGDEDAPAYKNAPRTNEESNSTTGENFHGTYSTPAIDPKTGSLFIGSGGNNYHYLAPGIDTPTTPFMRALDLNTLDDAWEMDDGDPKKYVKPAPPMYTNFGESGLSSPAVVNDVVFCSTTWIALYAFDTKTGATLWQDRLGQQTQGMNGGYGYCLGPAICGNYVVAGGLVQSQDGGILKIYKLSETTSYGGGEA